MCITGERRLHWCCANLDGSSGFRLPSQLIGPTVLRRLPLDAWILFGARFVRLFAYGSLSVVLVLYLIGIGLNEPQTGALLTMTLVGDTLVSLYLTTRADRMGRRRTLVVGRPVGPAGR